MAGMMSAIGQMGSTIGGTLGSIGAVAAKAGPMLGGAANAASTATSAAPALGSAIGSAAPAASTAAAAPMMSAMGPAQTGFASMSGGPVQGGALGQTIGQMQAGPMGLGPSSPMQTGRTAQSALAQRMSSSPPYGSAARTATDNSSQFWSNVKDELMSRENMMEMANRAGSSKVDNPPPQIGPMRFNNAPIQPGANLGLMGLSQLAQSYGRR